MKWKWRRYCSVLLLLSMMFSYLQYGIVGRAHTQEVTHHQHTFTCYDEFSLTCEEDHEYHTEECYSHSDNLICGFEEGYNHRHNEEGTKCEEYTRILICNIPEHTHTEDCLKVVENNSNEKVDGDISEDIPGLSEPGTDTTVTPDDSQVDTAPSDGTESEENVDGNVDVSVDGSTSEVEDSTVDEVETTPSTEDTTIESTENTTENPVEESTEDVTNSTEFTEETLETDEPLTGVESITEDDILYITDNSTELEPEYTCGLEEHTHTDDCYKVIYTCRVEDNVVAADAANTFRPKVKSQYVGSATSDGNAIYKLKLLNSVEGVTLANTTDAEEITIPIDTTTEKTFAPITFDPALITTSATVKLEISQDITNPVTGIRYDTRTYTVTIVAKNTNGTMTFDATYAPKAGAIGYYTSKEFAHFTNISTDMWQWDEQVTKTANRIIAEWEEGDAETAFNKILGQCLLVHYPEDGAGTVAVAQKAVQNYYIGGYLVFAAMFNGQTKTSVAKKIADTQSVSEYPLLFTVDEEGGLSSDKSRRILRITGGNNNPTNFRSQPFLSPQELKVSGGFEAVKNDAIEKGALLRELGLNVNHAPDCDISKPGGYIYYRTYGENGSDSAGYAEAAVEGHALSECGTTLKHFPGYGGTTSNTHDGLAANDLPREDIEFNDLIPFWAGTLAGCRSLMVTHNVIYSFNKTEPSSIAPEIYDYIRNTMHFDGVVMTDDLNMGAITTYLPNNSAGFYALKAGADMAMINCTRTGTIPDADYIRNWYKNASASDKSAFYSSIKEKCRRVLSWKMDLGLIPVDEEIGPDVPDVPTGEACTLNADGTLVNAGMFTEMWNEASANTGWTVKLLEDGITYSSTVNLPFARNLTLDLNGHDLTYTGTGSGITNSGYLSIIDSRLSSTTALTGEEEVVVEGGGDTGPLGIIKGDIQYTEIDKEYFDASQRKLYLKSEPRIHQVTDFSNLASYQARNARALVEMTNGTLSLSDVYLENPGGSFGIYAYSSAVKVSIANSCIANTGGGTEVSTDRGAISIVSGSLDMADSYVVGNHANKAAAGGIGLFSGESTITNSVISCNRSNINGGGIYCYYRSGSNPELTIIDSIISSNSTGNNGAGLYVWQSRVTLNNIDFYYNNLGIASGGTGAAIAAWGNATSAINLNINSCNIKYNDAGSGYGSAISATKGAEGYPINRVVIKDTTISDNIADHGAVYVLNSSAKMPSHISIQGNTYIQNNYQKVKPEQVCNVYLDGDSTVVLKNIHLDVKNGSHPNVGIYSEATQLGGTLPTEGNIDADASVTFTSDLKNWIAELEGTQNNQIVSALTTTEYKEPVAPGEGRPKVTFGVLGGKDTYLSVLEVPEEEIVEIDNNGKNYCISSGYFNHLLEEHFKYVVTNTPTFAVFNDYYNALETISVDGIDYYVLPKLEEVQVVYLPIGINLNSTDSHFCKVTIEHLPEIAGRTQRADTKEHTESRIYYVQKGHQIVFSLCDDGEGYTWVVDHLNEANGDTLFRNTEDTSSVWTLKFTAMQDTLVKQSLYHSATIKVQYFMNIRRVTRQWAKATISNLTNAANATLNSSVMFYSTHAYYDTSSNTAIDSCLPLVNGSMKAASANALNRLFLADTSGDNLLNEEEKFEPIFGDTSFFVTEGGKLSQLDHVGAKVAYRIKEVWVFPEGAAEDENYVPEGVRIYNINNLGISSIDDLKFVFTAEEASDTSIYLQDKDIVRYVYEEVELDRYAPVTFFDYDISDGLRYKDTTYTEAYSPDEEIPEGTAFYLKTDSEGINSQENYKEGSDYKQWFVFGNTNSGNFAKQYGAPSYNLGSNKDSDGRPFNSANRTSYANKFLDNYRDGHYGLVTSSDVNTGALTFKNGVVAPELFNSTTELIGKEVIAGYQLLFDRKGDTYTLKGVLDDQGTEVVSNASALIHPKPVYNNIWTNNFWPLDTYEHKDGKLHDPLFGADGTSTLINTTDASGKASPMPISDDGKAHNSYFGMNFEIDFSIPDGYSGNLDYYFYGDDDLWLFLDGKPVVDIGGVHPSAGVYTCLWDYIDPATDRNEDGTPKRHKLQCYYLERGASGSTCWMRFTVPNAAFSSEPLPTDTLGSMRISKEVEIEEGADTPSSYDFNIDLSLYSASDALIKRDFSYTIFSENGNIKETSVFVGGKGNFNLSKGDYILIANIPDGTKYKIEETIYPQCTTTIDNGVTQVESVTTEGQINNAERANIKYLNRFSPLRVPRLPSSGGEGTHPMTIYGIVSLSITYFLWNRKRYVGKRIM